MYIGFVSGGLGFILGLPRRFVGIAVCVDRACIYFREDLWRASGSANETDVGVCLPKGSKHQ